MGYITGQPFQEPVDGVRTVFTTLYQFEPGSIQVFQGNLPLTPEAFLELSTVQIRILDPDSHQVWSYDVLPNTVYCESHGLEADDQIALWSTVEDGLPEGLVHSVVYFVLAGDVNTFQVSLSQGGPAVNFAQASSGILYLAKPFAPLPENEELWYNATVLDVIVEPSLIVGFWVLSEWQRQYARLTPLSTVEDVLLDATAKVIGYVTEASWTTAEEQKEANEQQDPYRIFRRVIGELAFFYLLGRPGGLQQIKSSTKQYGDNTKKMSQVYDTSLSSIMEKTEKDIITQLIAYKKPVGEDETAARANVLTRSWGTGRNFGFVGTRGWTISQ